MGLGSSGSKRLLKHAALHKWRLAQATQPARQLSSSRVEPQRLDRQQIEELLSKPTWSVRALLPTEEQIASNTEVTPDQVQHLLRLCALPPPETPEQEARILRDLRAQLHFVKEIQKVDTTGVAPLGSIKDETAAGEKEIEINMNTLKDALEQEQIIGKYHKRIRRRRDMIHDAKEAEDWNVLGQAPRKVGRFFVVESAERGDN